MMKRREIGIGLRSVMMLTAPVVVRVLPAFAQSDQVSRLRTIDIEGLAIAAGSGCAPSC